MRGSSRDSAVPLKRRSPFTGTAESRVDSRISWRVPAVVVFLAVGPAVRASAAQCPDGSAPPCRSAVSAVAPPPNSVAVLYFDNLSADTAAAYPAEGLTHELLPPLRQRGRPQVQRPTITFSVAIIFSWRAPVAPSRAPSSSTRRRPESIPSSPTPSRARRSGTGCFSSGAGPPLPHRPTRSSPGRSPPPTERWHSSRPPPTRG